MEKWPYKFDGGQNLTEKDVRDADGGQNLTEKDVRDAIEKLQRVLQTEITFKKV